MSLKSVVIALSAVVLLAPLAAAAEGAGVGGLKQPPGSLFELAGWGMAVLGLIATPARSSSWRVGEWPFWG